MTDLTNPHLDEEALSAATDGEATPGEQAHLAACADCRVRAAALGAVARAVGTPVPPPAAAVVDGAVAAALAGWSPVATGSDAVPALEGALLGGGHTAGTPAATSGAGVGHGNVRTLRPALDRSGGSGPRRLALAVAGAGVAAAVLVVGLVALNSSRHGSVSTSVAGGAAPSASSRAPVGSSASGASDASGASATNGTAGRQIADLGNQSDPRALAAIIRSAAQKRSTAAAAPPAFAPSGATTTVEPFASGDNVVPIPCLAEAREAVGLSNNPTAPVVYEATLQWHGQAAVVVAFARPNGLAAEVVGVNGCVRLATVPF